MQTETRATLAQAARGRSNLYRTLSSCLAEPTVAMVRELRGEAFQRFLSTALAEARETIETVLPEVRSRLDRDDEAARLELEVAYNRLFVGPGHVLVPPYESVYRTDVPELERGLVMGKSTVDVRQIYARHQMALCEGFPDLPDHVQVELEFMAQLTAQEADLWEGAAGKDNQAALDSLLSTEQAFLHDHLVWFLPFARQLRGCAEEPFYAALGEMLEALIRAEQAGDQ